MKNIFIEGIQGAGKTTLVNEISKLNPKLHVCREGDYNPIDLAWCALMSEKEYEQIIEKYNDLEEEIQKNTVREKEDYIVTYTKIHADIPGFYKVLENYEVYCGRKTWPKLKEIILERFRGFTQTGYLFECAFFQNIVEDLILFHMLSDEEIVDFYRELFRVAGAQEFLLFYLHTDGLEESINIIKSERCDDEGNEMWFQMMLEYLTNSPYGRKHGCKSWEDLIHHFKHRQELELFIIKEVLGEKAVVLPAKEYDRKLVLSLVAG